MKRLIIVVGIFLEVLAALCSANDQTSQIDVNDCNIKQIFAEVYNNSPRFKYESAAWIVLGSKGEYVAVNWGKIPQTHKQVWERILPENIVAIAHTHPDHIDPKPSYQDQIVAKKMKIFVYTLSRRGVWSVSPQALIIQNMGLGWTKKIEAECKVRMAVTE